MDTPKTNDQKLLNAKCDYYWPFLRTIWDPPSKIHWFMGIIFLGSLSKKGATIPPNLILGAARHGQVMLKGRANTEALQEIIMQELMYPSCPKEWDRLLFMSKKQAVEELRCERRKQSAWRPVGYEQNGKQAFCTPAYRVEKNQRARHRGGRLTTPLKVQLNRALHYLKLLFGESATQRQKLLSSPRSQSIRQKAKKIHSIDFSSISTSEIDNRSDECAICRDPLHDRDTLYLKVMAKAQNFTENDKPRYVSSQRAYNARQKEHIDNFVKSLDRIDNDESGNREIKIRGQLFCDLWNFATAVLGAKEYLEKMEQKQTPRCFYPTKLACGHIFGLKCIDTWILQKKTCPMCRAELPGLLVPRVGGAGREITVRSVELGDEIVVVPSAQVSGGQRRRTTGGIRLRRQG